MSSYIPIELKGFDEKGLDAFNGNINFLSVRELNSNRETYHGKTVYVRGTRRYPSVFSGRRR